MTRSRIDSLKPPGPVWGIEKVERMAGVAAVSRQAEPAGRGDPRLPKARMPIPCFPPKLGYRGSAVLTGTR
jgi:hypothetical protein